MLVMAACEGGEDEPVDTTVAPTSPPTSSVSSTTSIPPEEVFGIDAAIGDLEARLPGVAVSLVSAKNVTWPDASLGCPQPDRFYAQVFTDGVWIVLSAGNRNYVYHGDRSSVFLCETPQDPFAPS